MWRGKGALLKWKIQLADAIIDRIAHDSYRINITSIDAEHDISMRGLWLGQNFTRVNSHKMISTFRTSDFQITGSAILSHKNIYTVFTKMSRILKKNKEQRIDRD